MFRKFATSIVALSIFFIAAAFVNVRAESPAAEPAMADYLKRVVSILASDIGQRNCYRPENLERTMSFIEGEFEDLGNQVSTQEVLAEDPKFKCRTPLSRNIIAELKGTSKPDEIVLVGAHYDTKVAMPKWNGHKDPIPDQAGTPGADDNASGVAATLLLAKLFANNPQARTIRFVAFTNEEPPFFRHPSAMGSWVYAQESRKRNENIVAMVSLETLGVYSEQPRTKLPLFRFLANRIVLSSSSDYVAFLGNRDSQDIMATAANEFRQSSPVRLRTLSLPELSKRIAWSDDWSFWQEGYKAFSVTDTAYLRHDHYHELSDTAEKLDYPIFSSVVTGIHASVRSLAN